MDPIVKLKTYIVEDERHHPRKPELGTLEELASVESVGAAATEDEGKSLAGRTPAHWDLAIVDLFLRQGSGLGVLAACRQRLPTSAWWCSGDYTTPDVRVRCAQLGVDAGLRQIERD